MPELPEVETIVVQLGKKVVGETITGFSSEWKKNVLPSCMAFMRQTKGAKVIGTRRFGKHIVIDLDNEYSIVIHLKMTGHLLWKTDENRLTDAFMKDPYNGYIRHMIAFDGGATLEFSDMRKFGWLHAMRTEEVEKLSSIKSLGIDALSPALTTKRFRELIGARTKRTIGEALLEQDLVAGIGNIYRSEALFLAGVRPDRIVVSMTDDEWKKMLPAIKTVLQKAVKLRGTTDGDFRDIDGLPGRFQRTLFVYGREKLPCKKCGTIIVRKKIGQRSVFYCANCQK
jgi:formamidopyrimidine-DNA glycosylase